MENLGSVTSALGELWVRLRIQAGDGAGSLEPAGSCSPGHSPWGPGRGFLLTSLEKPKEAGGSLADVQGSWGQVSQGPRDLGGWIPEGAFYSLLGTGFSQKG